MVSEQTLREVAALAVYDEHKVSTRPIVTRHEAHCACGWISDDAYGDRFDAGSAGARHQEQQLTREFQRLGIGDKPSAQSTSGSSLITDAQRTSCLDNYDA